MFNWIIWISRSESTTIGICHLWFYLNDIMEESSCMDYLPNIKDLNNVCYSIVWNVILLLFQQINIILKGNFSTFFELPVITKICEKSNYRVLYYCPTCILKTYVTVVFIA